MKNIFLILSIALISLQAKQPNIIFMIGDGMGPAITTAYRYFKDDPKTKEVEKTILDELYVGSSSTYSYEAPPVVTDSAAAATALATGVKTKNGYIGVNEDKQELQTLLEKAKLFGYQTAMLVTSTLTHATPASFIAHHDNRRDEAEIAKDYLDKNILGMLKFDLLMGGGLRHFEEAFSDFPRKLAEEGITLYKDRKSIKRLKKLPAMAFTAYDKPPFAIDMKEGDQPYRSKQMLKKALTLMDSKRPFFMMVEGSQIDWCGHENDMACALREMDDFVASIKLAKAYVDTHSNTLLIITADHSTGGLAIGQKIGKKSQLSKKERKRKSYQWNPSVLKKIKISATAMTKKVFGLGDARKIEKLFVDHMAIALTKKERQTLAQESLRACKKFKSCKLHDKISSIVDKRSHTAWTTHGHTAVDVPVFAYGQSSSLFHGFMDNTDISKKLASLLK